MKIVVGIATTGRADVLDQTAIHWSQQTQPYHRFVASGASDKDVGPGVRTLRDAQVLVGTKGLPVQRNAILDAIAGDCDLLVYADDDYVPSRYFLERVARTFATHADVVALTGRVLADGITSAGIAYGEARDIVAAEDAETSSAAPPAPLKSTHSTYGCNMVFRIAAAPDLRFDEALPLYGWQEDVDYSAGYAKLGRIVIDADVFGVHMGSKGGRVSGVRLGYSQIANPIYLMRKGTMRPVHALPLMARNVAMNALKTFTPEPWIDRKGRLWGNVLALGEGLIGRQRPDRILKL